MLYIHVFLRSVLVFLHSVFSSSPASNVCTSFFALFGCKHACIFPFVIELVYIVRLPMLVLLRFFFRWKENRTITTERFDCSKRSGLLSSTLPLSLSPIISIIAIGLSTTFNYKCISGKTVSAIVKSLLPMHECATTYLLPAKDWLEKKTFQTELDWVAALAYRIDWHLHRFQHHHHHHRHRHQQQHQ